METQEPAACDELLSARARVEGAELYNHPLSGQVISCAIEVHRYLGPGLLEAAYEQCLAHELRLRKIPFKVQAPMSHRTSVLRLSISWQALPVEP